METSEMQHVESNLFFRIVDSTGSASATKHKDGMAKSTAKCGIQVFIQVEDVCKYEAFCLDFGPYNMASMYDFFAEIRKARSLVTNQPGSEVIVQCDAAKKNITNTVCLLGAHLVVNKGYSAEQAWGQFAHMDQDMLLPFHDATYLKECFPLSILDCLQGLEQALRYEHIKPNLEDFNIEHYKYYDHPLNGDLHEVVPGKFVAFCGPSKKRQVYSNHCYTLTPKDFHEAFHDMGVTTIVRLNKREENEYDATDFTSAGFNHFDLIFDDCTTPSPEIVQRFLAICESSASGLVAVHCKAGLGRTGTLIALWMMKHNYFTATETIGWLRLMRPGSVIAQQQEYLVAMKDCMWRQNATYQHVCCRVAPPPATNSLSPITINQQKKKAYKSEHCSFAAQKSEEVSFPSPVTPFSSSTALSAAGTPHASSFAVDSFFVDTYETEHNVEPSAGRQVELEDGRHPPPIALPTVCTLGQSLPPVRAQTGDEDDIQFRMMGCSLTKDMSSALTKKLALDNTISMQKRAEKRMLFQFRPFSSAFLKPGRAS